jgi:hypothetical protein
MTMAINVIGMPEPPRSSPKDVLSGIVSRLRELRAVASPCTPPIPEPSTPGTQPVERSLDRVAVADLTLFFHERLGQVLQRLERGRRPTHDRVR